MKIKNLTYFILIVSLLTSCYNQERNCTDFKKGTFEFSQEINGKIEKSVFERNDSIQIETFRNTKDTSLVRWVNDCEFILQKLHPKTMNEKKAVQMKILTTNKEGYIFEYNFVGDANKKRGSVIKIN